MRLQAEAVPEAVREALRSASLTVEADAAEDSTVQDIVGAAQADYGRLVAILYENGYFGPVVSIALNGREAADLSPLAPPERIDEIVISVEPGPVFSFGTARIGPLADGTELPATFASGQVATTPAMRRAAEAGITGWRQAGHAAARVAGQQITAQQAQAVVNATIALEPGPTVTFGELVPEGHERMRADRIREIAGLPVGEIYTPAALQQATDRLRRTGVFSVVALEETTLNPDDSMDVVAVVDEFPLRRFGFGAELATEEGGTLSGYWLHRNLLGGAERLRFDAEVSGLGGQTGGIDYEASAAFSRPATFDPETSLRLGIGAERVEDPTFTQTTLDLSAGLERIVSDRLTVGAGVRLGYSDSDDAFGPRELVFVTLPIEASYDTRDDEADPSGGYYLNALAEPFVSDRGASGLYGTADLRGYVGLGASDRTVLAGRLQLGTLAGVERAEAPAGYLFLSGGGGSVRGQPYDSLGIPTGSAITGGRGFLATSVELRQRIGDRFGIVGFYDYGVVSEGPIGSGDGGWHSGAGIGVRYLTPVGPIRLDVAAPVAGDEAGDSAVLYIGIGQSF